MALLHAGLGFKPPHPEITPVPRPGQQQQPPPAAPRMSTAAEIRAFFSGEGARVIVDTS